MIIVPVRCHYWWKLISVIKSLNGDPNIFKDILCSIDVYKQAQATEGYFTFIISLIDVLFVLTDAIKM